VDVALVNKQKADKPGIPPLLTKDNKSAETDKDKAETLNKQFTNVFRRSEYDAIPYQQPTTESMSKIIVTSIVLLRQWTYVGFFPFARYGPHVNELLEK
jgi:hypothetical protein